MMPNAALADSPSLPSSAIQTARLEMEQLKHIIKVLGSEVKSAREKAEELQKEKEDLHLRLDQRETSFFQECQRMKQAVHLLEEEKSTLTSQKEIMERNYESYSSLLKENEQLKRDIERIQKELKESSVSSDGLKRSQETTEPHSPQLARFAMELSKAQEEVHGLSCERAALIRAHKEADQEVKRLLEDTKTLQAQLALFEQEGKESQRITENHKNEIEALQNNIFALKTLLEDEKKLSLSLTDEKEAIDTLFRKELEAKTALTAQTLQLGKDLENKNVLLNTREERINFLETALSELEKEYQESEKRLKETEELLVLKISYLDSLEEQMEQLKEDLLTNEEERKAIEKEKTILSLNLEEELKKGLLLKERNESISKDLEESRQATLQTSRRLSLLEGWKRRTDQSLNQVKNSLENLYEYEKQLEHETSCHQENMNFPVDSSFFKPMTRDHGSLF